MVDGHQTRDSWPKWADIPRKLDIEGHEQIALLAPIDRPNAFALEHKLFSGLRAGLDAHVDLAL